MAFLRTEDKETNRKTIFFKIEKDVFDAKVTEVFRKKSKNINIPGFRKGKAPRPIIEKMYGKGVFYEDALNELIPDAYEEARKASELKIVSRPEIDIEEMNDEGVTVKADVWVKPAVDIKDYKGIAATKCKTPVTDKDIDDRISADRERTSSIEDVTDRAAETGDIVNIDYKGFCDGEAFEGGEASNQELTLGSNTFIPGFEDQIAGKNIGEEFDVNVTFPEDYHAENLKGKAAVFKCKLNGIKKKILPELNDDFAKDVSEFDTFDEYRNNIKETIEKERDDAGNAEVNEQLMEAIAEKLEADIPQCMFDNEAENLVRDYDMRLRYSGLSLDMYLKYTGKTLDDMRKDMLPQAEKHVKTRLALEAISAKENLTASDEEVDKEVEKIATSNNIDKEKIFDYVSRDDIIADIKAEKAMNLVKEAAVISEHIHDHEHEHDHDHDHHDHDGE